MLDLTSLPPMEDNIVANRLQPVDTHSQLPKLVDGGSIDFHVDASSTECISLLESFLYFQLKVVKYNANGDEEKVVKEDKVSYSPFVMSSIFKNISMKINDEEISQSADNYHAYEAYVNTLVQLSKPGMQQVLDGSGLELSPPGAGSALDPKSAELVNRGLAVRHSWCNESKVHGFTSPIIWPPFLVPRVLPTHCELALSLNLNNADFVLIAKPKKVEKQQEDGSMKELMELPKVRIKIVKAQLYLQKYRLSPLAQIRQEQMLASGAKYPMIVNKTTSFVLERGSTEGFRALTIASELPRMCYVFMVARDRVNALNSSPFLFENFGLNNMYLEADGVKYPNSLAYNPDFSASHYIKDFRIAQKELNFANSDPFINSFAWVANYSIYPFNLVPDRSIGCEYVSVPENKAGNLNLHLAFEKELEQAVCVFVIMEFYKVLNLDSQRKPTWS